jgi:hypothetical protein
MHEPLQSLAAVTCLLLSILALVVNSPTVVNILLRPSLWTTLNNLTCALLTVNMAFGFVYFLFAATRVAGWDLVATGNLCTGLICLPQFYRIISLYILLGSLFLRSLFVQHADYISLVSRRNDLVISDFGLPIWITIFTFVLLNILFMVLHPKFPTNFPNVRLCMGKTPFRAETKDEEMYRKTILITIAVCILLAIFLVMLHCTLHIWP